MASHASAWHRSGAHQCLLVKHIISVMDQGASPTFSTGGVGQSKSPVNRGVGSKSLHYISWCRGGGDVACGSDSRWGLRWQGEVELPDQDFLVGFEFGVSAEDQGAGISGRE